MIQPDPIAVTAVWFPGRNSRSCTEPITRGDAAVAHRLARDIRAARPGTGRANNCAFDDGTGVIVYFTYAQRPAAAALVALAGCVGVAAPGSLPSLWFPTSGFFTDIAPLVPPNLRERVLPHTTR